jgi:hypothetical protein
MKDGIDFDRVEMTLIRPALDQLAIESAGAVYSSGNLQASIFAQLATVDLVVADVSGSPPIVNFELGVRYTARDRFTVLVQARSYPPNFHLQQLRSLGYDPFDPSSSVLELASLINETIRAGRVDSPVYIALPNLQPPSLPELDTAPPSFSDEVARASIARDSGHLALLAAEVGSLHWRLQGLRLIAKAQINIRDYTGSQKCLEVLRGSEPDDVEVNALLGTVYDRLGKPVEARLALDRVLSSPSASQTDRAEALALTARNLKTEWTELWQQIDKPEQRSLKAFRSPLLKGTRQAYLRAYKEDLNHYDSGLNALALTQVQLQLALKNKEVWEDRFEDQSESETALKREEQLATALAGAVDLSLSSAAETAARKGLRDPWIDISRADLIFLTSKRPQRIGRLYEDALSQAPPFARDSVRRQLQMHVDLGVFAETAQPVLEFLGVEPQVAPVRTTREINRVLLFSGLSIDSPGRQPPRFPAYREDVARQAIERAIAAEQIAEGNAIGLAGGSNGGDILFHEVCHQNNIKTELYLPIPEDEYVGRSVLPAGGDWLARFKSLRDYAPVHVLQASVELPEWLRDQALYSFWQRSNRWLLHSALAFPGASVTLIALFNGVPSEEPGGTMDMIAQARALGAHCVVLNTNQIFGLS